MSNHYEIKKHFKRSIVPFELYYVDEFGTPHDPIARFQDGKTAQLVAKLLTAHVQKESSYKHLP